jgi:hypothetical protein
LFRGVVWIASSLRSSQRRGITRICRGNACTSCRCRRDNPRCDRVVSQGERDAVTNEVHTLLAPFVMRHEVVSS